ncbi:MAG: phosphoribosylformylglycinamidine synthase subunit PurL [Pirellulaceae bacterium]|nr:phosphoribosylformylglycinamidine synthase subunit PurL [Pirellulaceae bacterium]
MTLWEVDVLPAEGQPDLHGRQLSAEALDLGLAGRLSIRTARGYLVQGALDRRQVATLAAELLADAVVEQTRIRQLPGGDGNQAASPNGTGLPGGHHPPDGLEPPGKLVHVLLKPGVMDPVAQSALDAAGRLGVPVEAVRTLRKYWLDGLDPDRLDLFCGKLLANDSVELVIPGPLRLERLETGQPYRFRRVIEPLRELDDEGLRKLSERMQLYLSLAEMRTIQEHFRGLDREPTDVELETIAQTWSEHCSHKTLAGRIAYSDEHGERQFENMLKETIFEATRRIRQQLGDDDWCVSVFQDNAGVVRFDDQFHVVFKVETHNHPSALEPYGGANTGLGGVIRDPLGTGLGARPVCNTDVFCFAPPDTPHDQLPPGVLHPRRIMRGVVSGVRDYGNRMGIPTVNGAVYFDPRYLGNPLVYCGNVGLLPRDMWSKQTLAGDLIVVVGGRTGRDGIHGATFSSAELHSGSDVQSGGAVQIGNAITEKMVVDVLLQARDQGLYRAITDCGAGGLSSAVGEMGAELGAVVWLDRAPLKYDGLSYTEIWISEAQERMVLSVPPENWEALRALCAAEGVEATVIGQFEATDRLRLLYEDQQVADLRMDFLHDGRPPVIRQARYEPAPARPLDAAPPRDDYEPVLRALLGSLNIASKEWVIRQYDHEVQGGSVIKPLVGVANDGPSDAAVVRPVLESRRGLVLACGMNPYYGDLDTYHMAASAIDEALRNCVAVGADPARIAILDNFCWGYTDRPETLGSLVRAALACQEVAIGFGTPFISGKDSLNNEFRYVDADGRQQAIAIPPSLLISALGQVDDVRTCVTMDLKSAGNLLYQVGLTRDELGGSHFALVEGLVGGQVPRVDVPLAKATFAALHRAIVAGTVRACHDLSEGGLVVALAEMAFAGGLGAEVTLAGVPCDESVPSEMSGAGGRGVLARLFAESNSRFLCEVPVERQQQFEQLLADVPHARIGQVTAELLTIRAVEGGPPLVEADPINLKAAWQAPLRWR